MNFNHFRGLYDGLRIDPVIVCNIERPLADVLGARVTRVLLSPETLEKQKIRHPDLKADDYVALRPAILFGEVRQDGDGRAVVLYVDRYWWDTAFGPISRSQRTAAAFMRPRSAD